jgi:hypothetical protein
MKRYDALESPNAAEWLDLDEQERLDLVLRYHRRARERIPNVHLHAIIHAIVENQIAMGDELPVRRTLERLLAEGLDRHDAIHAIGSVLAWQMYGTLRHDPGPGDPNREYWAKLEDLSAEGWREGR